MLRHIRIGLIMVGVFGGYACAFQAETLKTLKADLNGDGKKETITLKVDSEEAGSPYTLKVGSLSVRGKVEDATITGLAIVDINAKDRYKEIEINGEGPNLLPAHVFYRLVGKKLIYLGRIFSSIEIDGSSKILSRSWTGFVTMSEFYAVDVRTKRLKVVLTPDLHPMDAKVTIDKPFNVYLSLDMKRVIERVKIHQSVTLVAAKLLPGWHEDKVYGLHVRILVKTSRGLMGWVKMSDMVNNVSGFPSGD